MAVVALYAQKKKSIAADLKHGCMPNGMIIRVLTFISLIPFEILRTLLSPILFPTRLKIVSQGSLHHNLQPS